MSILSWIKRPSRFWGGSRRMFFLPARILTLTNKGCATELWGVSVVCVFIPFYSLLVSHPCSGLQQRWGPLGPYRWATGHNASSRMAMPKSRSNPGGVIPLAKLHANTSSQHYTRALGPKLLTEYLPPSGRASRPPPPGPSRGGLPASRTSPGVGGRSPAISNRLFRTIAIHSATMGQSLLPMAWGRPRRCRWSRCLDA